MENRSLIKKVLETDPAARYALNVIINYPGVHAMFCYRINSFLWKKLHLKFLARMFSQIARFLRESKFILGQLLESVYLLIMVWG